MLFVDIVVRPLLYAALVAAAFIPLERLAPLRTATRSRWSTDVLLATFGGILVRAALVLGSGALLAVVDRPHGPLSGLPLAVSLPLALVVFDLGGYAYHRAAHRVPLLWRLHRLHHESTSMDWLASFRQHPLEIVLLTAAQNLPLVLLGLPLGVHALLILALKLHTVLVHANLRTPRALAPWLALPDFHHRHHDAVAPDANYASLFPWVDRFFGTFEGTTATRFGTRAQGATSQEQTAPTPGTTALHVPRHASGARQSQLVQPAGMSAQRVGPNPASTLP